MINSLHIKNDLSEDRLAYIAKFILLHFYIITTYRNYFLFN